MMINNMNHPIHEMRVLVAFAKETDRFLPEGPRGVVVAGREALAWVNIQTAADSTQGTIHLRFWDNSERCELPQPAQPGFVLPTDRTGMVVVGREKEIGLLDLQTNSWAACAIIPDSNPRTIINDGEIVPGGRAIVFGTKDVRFAGPIGHLYLLTLDDKRLSILADGQTCSNGKVLARVGNELLLFDIDTPKRNVVRYRLDLDKRRIEDKRVALDLKEIEGFPDGMIDAGDGSAIIAFYNPGRGGAGQALRFRLDTGEIVEEWTTPGSPRVTCPLLVQRDSQVQLVLTTAVEGMPAEFRALSPNAGDLFIGATSVPGIPTVEFVRI
jgi:sugar lactone lactonase YvrE